MDVHFPSKQSWWFPKSQTVSLFQRVNHHFRPINPSFPLPFSLPLEERSSAKASPPPQRSPDLKRPAPDWSGIRDIHEKMAVEPTRILWKSGGHSHIYIYIIIYIYISIWDLHTYIYIQYISNQNDMHPGLHWHRDENSTLFSLELDLNMVDVPYVNLLEGNNIHIVHSGYLT